VTALLTDEAVAAEASLYSINMQKTIHEEEPGRFQAFEVGISARSFHDGAQFARSIYEARLAEDAKVRAQLVEALQDLLAYAESQICSHEETHRGGAIWEICDICGDCWADDDGGKPPRQDPEEIVATRSALLAAAKEIK
jgi:hypothetical protein